MTTRRLSAYRARSAHGYALGRYAVEEALRHCPELVEAILVEGPAEAPEGMAALVAAAGVAVERDDAAVTRLRHRSDIDCLAVIRKVQQRLEPGCNHVVLVRPSQFGNVGSAMRSMAAFGYRDLALIDPRVDHWSPHVIRASVGLRFALRCQVFVTAADYRAAFPSHLAYLFDSRGAVELGELTLRSPHGLWFGPEGGDRLGQLEGALTVRIAQDPAVESLNLAAAVSLAVYLASTGKRGDSGIIG